MWFSCGCDFLLAVAEAALPVSAQVVRSMMLALLSMTEPDPKKLPMNIVQAAWWARS